MMTLSDLAAIDRVTKADIHSFVLYLFGVSLVVYTLYYAVALHVTRTRFANTFLGVGLAIFYLSQIEPSTNIESKSTDVSGFFSRTRFGLTKSYIRFRDRYASMFFIGLAITALSCSMYVELNFERLRDTAPIVGFTTVDYVVGVLLLYLAIDSTKRAYGWGIASVVIVSILYAFAGPHLFGIFEHSGLSWRQITREGAIGLQGVYGFILGVGATWIAVFIFFAGLAKTYGLLEFILGIGENVSSHFRTGIIHIATAASLALGSITGSAAANTATTGSFTIPMMKQQGVEGEYAAAIEGVASAGGQIMPPVMGVAAFLMADILSIPYVRVIQAALLPAILFYISVAVSVHFIALKRGWEVERTNERFDYKMIAEGLHFAIPVGVLIYLLVVERLTPLSAGLYTIFTLIGVVFLKDLYVEGLRLEVIFQSLLTTLEGFKEGAIDMAPLVGVLASMGVIIQMVTQTGLSQKLSTQIITLSGGVFVFLLILAMITSILFGLGMPTPAAYILVVILVAPALLEFGVQQITAHMFVFYFAMLSAITPPVAISVAIGCQISGSKFLPTAKQALRIGAPGFVIPFAFVANENLIYWEFYGTILSVLVVFSGLMALSIGLTGYNGRHIISKPRKIFYVGLSGVMLFGPLSAQLIAVAIGITIFLYTNVPFFGFLDYSQHL